MLPLVIDRVSVVGTTITIVLTHSAGDTARVVVTVEILQREADKHVEATFQLGAPRHTQEVVNTDSVDVSHTAHPTSRDLLQCQAEVARLTAQLADSDEALGFLDDSRNELEYQVANYRELVAGMERERPRLWDLIHVREAQLGAANTHSKELETELTDAHQTITEQSGVLDMLAEATIVAVPC